MPAEFAFEHRLAESFPPSQWIEAGVLVAYSAGPDSTALLAGLASLTTLATRGSIAAAHFNHRLRDAESDADEAHAAAEAERLGVRYVAGRRDTVRPRGEGIEEAARDERYRFLIDAAMRLGVRYVVTAHTLDDQAETVLHRLLRGTGLTGLGGIPRSRSLADGAIGLVRPLLNVRRTEVMDYLTQRRLAYRVDASNADVRFTRNKLRHVLLPLLQAEFNPQIAVALANLANQADDLREFVGELVEPLVDRAVVRRDEVSCELDCTVFVGRPRHLVREAFVTLWRRCGWPRGGMGYAEWGRLADLAGRPDARPDVLPGSVVAERRGAMLVLCKSQR